ncbi:MAG: hypothetical protein ACFFBF_13650 [Promethearchaeota archaeon]
MIVSQTDNIPTKKIVKILGKIKVKDFKELGEAENMQRLIRKAKAMGADAIINYAYGRLGLFDIVTTYWGFAVKTEDIIPIQRVLNTSVCCNCGTHIEKDQRFCGRCGTKLI